ncbi:MAG: hypothetical protein IT201_14510 [Thermoleophilia bacterium]|nr:hypothetical protein [Thermoleophilia bacterium]
MVDSIARSLKALGFVGARWYVRRCPDLAVLVEALGEVRSALANGAEIRNPAGLVRWLVNQELASRERYDIHVDAGTPEAIRPPEHADWWGRRRAV